MSVQEKKPFPEERAAKLALAREKALEVRRKNKEIKMRAELEKMETARTNRDEPPPDPVVEKEIERIGHTEVDLEDEGLAEDEIESAPAPAPVKKVVKKKPKKQQVVIVEQSDDDSDEFESQPNVVFVKRTKPKKKTTEPVQPAPLPPPPQTAAPEPPPKPRLTQEQMQVQSYYNNMFNGNFAMQRRR